MFFFLIYGAAVLTMIGMYWVSGRLLELYGMNVKHRLHRVIRVGVGALTLIFFLYWRTMGLLLLVLLLTMLLFELFAFIGRKIVKRRCPEKLYRFSRIVYRSSFVPLVVTVLFMRLGFINMNRIVCKEYTITSEKLHSEYNIVYISDTHYGTVQRRRVLRDKLPEISALNADFIILGGDIVDENTSKEDMEAVFEMLGGLQSKYGVYYVYGNHDRQRYNGEDTTYSAEELEAAILKNNIVILNDKTTLFGDDLLLAGREDIWAENGRMPIAELLKDADRSRFLLTADHQPKEVGENAAEGVDLIVSGHTHAGQIFPLGYFIPFGYGLDTKHGTSIITSSGAAGWGFIVRTQQHCEYLLLHLKPQA